MASLLGFLRKTLKNSTNIVRRVGKVSSNTLRKGTNLAGLTKSKKVKKSKTRKNKSRKSQQ